MATVVFQPAQSGPATAPSAPLKPIAVAGDTTAGISWSTPVNGGSPITSYTVTPYLGNTALTAVKVDRQPRPHVGHRHRPDQRLQLHLQGHGHQRRRHQPGLHHQRRFAVTQPGGTWAPLQTWPIMPLATHLLYNGKTISWDGWQQPQPSVVWDPANPSVYTTINRARRHLLLGSRAAAQRRSDDRRRLRNTDHRPARPFRDRRSSTPRQGPGGRPRAFTYHAGIPR